MPLTVLEWNPAKRETNNSKKLHPTQKTIVCV